MRSESTQNVYILSPRYLEDDDDGVKACSDFKMSYYKRQPDFLSLPNLHRLEIFPDFYQIKLHLGEHMSVSRREEGREEKKLIDFLQRKVSAQLPSPN